MAAQGASIRGTSAAEIVASVRDLVERGALQQGTLLPPVRVLAEDLGLNRNTIAAAYRQLAERGLVDGRGRAGTVIASSGPLRGEGVNAPVAAVDLAGGNPDPELLFDLRSVFASAHYEPPLYGAPAVLPALREQADRLFATDVAEPYALSVTHGALDAIERLLGAALVRGDIVAVEDPGYLASTGIVSAMGFQQIGIRVDRRGVDPPSLEAALERGARAVICTSRAHNPTGASLDRERAGSLRKILADRPGVFVIEDDHLSFLATSPYEPVRSPRTARWALVRSMAKTFSPDLRVALVASDAWTEEQLARRLSAGVNWVSQILQATAATLLDDPATPRRLAKARGAYARRSARLCDALHQQGIAVLPPRDGWNVWVPLPGNDEQVVDALAGSGWQVRPGSAYAVDPGQGLAALRITTSTLSAREADRLAAALSEVLT